MSRVPLFVGSIFVIASVMLVGRLVTNDDSAPIQTAWPRGDTPNILLIVTDDQRWDELGIVQKEQGQDARFAFLETPNLDTLAMQGTRFRNAFVTTSLCSPSRSSILTGQYAHAHSVIDNMTPFSPKPTWATALKGAGYTTAYFGKWHHNLQETRPGFEFFATFRGQGDYHDTPFLVSDQHEDVKTTGYVDERSVDFLVDYLKKPMDRPFAIMLGLKGVHQPFTPMDEHGNSYRQEKIASPRNWSAFPPWRLNKKAGTRAPDHNFWLEILKTVRGVDKNVGRILDTLDALELADNTVVIFTSDNGYYLGEHSLGDKRSAYEESIRVPMLVRYPGVVPAGETSDAMVLNIDLAPTIIELAGKTIPKGTHGRSMRQLFSKDTANWRNAFLYEHWQLPYDQKKWRKDDPKARNFLNILKTPTILSIRTERYKLITYLGKPAHTELFDLNGDPFETQNLASSKDYAELRSDLCGRLKALASEYQYSYSFPVEKWITDSQFPKKADTLYGKYITDPSASFPDFPDCQG